MSGYLVLTTPTLSSNVYDPKWYLGLLSELVIVLLVYEDVTMCGCEPRLRGDNCGIGDHHLLAT